MDEVANIFDSVDINMLIILGASLLVLGFIALITAVMRRRGGLNKKYFGERWKNILSLVKDPKTWQQAIIDSDKLVDEALKRRHFKGQTMGERLVNASKVLTDQDGIWSAHKLRNRLVHETDVNLKKGNVKMAVKGYYHALRDLGAL